MKERLAEVAAGLLEIACAGVILTSILFFWVATPVGMQ